MRGSTTDGRNDQCGVPRLARRSSTGGIGGSSCRLLERGHSRQPARMWWCPNSRTVLFNERCSRQHAKHCGAVCASDLERYFGCNMPTKLLDGLNHLDWPVRRQTTGSVDPVPAGSPGHRSGAGRSSTRPDTVFGARIHGRRPEHPLVIDRPTPSVGRFAAHQSHARERR